MSFIQINKHNENINYICHREKKQESEKEEKTNAKTIL